jgi:acyl-CoA thioesterase
MRLPFVRHVGLQHVEHGPRHAVWSLAIEPQHMNGSGVVHGGALFTLADTCMGSALYAMLEAGEDCATIELKIAYLRPALAGELRCRADVIHKGRRVAHLEAAIHAGDALLCKATGSFAIFERRQRAATPPAADDAAQPEA